MGNRIDVVAQPQTGNPLGRPQVHIGAVPGRVDHPDFFVEKHDLQPSEQASLDAFTDDPETVNEMLEQMVQNGGAR